MLIINNTTGKNNPDRGLAFYNVFSMEEQMCGICSQKCAQIQQLKWSKSC